MKNRYWYTQETLHAYNEKNGLYEPCEREVRREIRKRLGNEARTTRVKEVFDHIKEISEDGKSVGGAAFLNGVLDFSTMELKPHSPENYILHGFSVKYASTKTCNRFNKWVYELVDDGDCYIAIMEMIGSLFDSNVNDLQKAFILTGAGSNGKSMLLEIIDVLLGDTNVCKTEFTKFGEGNFSLSSLVNKSAAIDDDIDKRKSLNSIMKSLITAKSIEVEVKYKSAFTADLKATFVGAINGHINSRDNTKAFWRRWIIIPFEKQFKEDANFKKELIAECTTPEALAGIASTGLDFYKKALDRGAFTIPEKSKEMVNFLRTNSNNVIEFVDECLEKREGNHEPKNSVFESYLAWCETNSHNVYSRQRFYDALESEGFNVRERITLNGKQQRVVKNCFLFPLDRN